MVFKCLTTASWSLNYNNGDTIGNSSVTLKVIYSQAEGELINSFHIAVYDSAGTTFFTSETMYDVSEEVVVSGLLNASEYFIRAYGTTVNGLILDTRGAADISITTDYTTPTIYAYAYLDNEPYEGFV